MKERQKEKKQAAYLLNALLGIGAAVGIWAMAAFVSSLAKVDWQVSEMFRQYLVAVGALGEFETMVDFYSYIKGIEYIICVAFLGAFPAFFKYLSKTKASVPQ